MAVIAREQRFAGSRKKCCSVRLRGSAPKTPAGGPASGTEPKIKLYVNVNDRDEAKARELLSHLTEESRKLLK